MNINFSPRFIKQIRILPSDKKTFAENKDFYNFVTETMVDRGGLYYFPNTSMNCPANTLVLFQYGGMIRAIGVLVEIKKYEEKIEGKYTGHYRFDLGTLKYLESPIDKYELHDICPTFKSFNQSKQRISLEYLDAILDLLQSRNQVKFINNDNEISNIEKLNLEGSEKEAIVKVRVNQSQFRKNLILRHHKCMLCGVENTDFLVASHIKPWSDSDASEKLVTDNGLLLCANHDCLFDKGWITFDDDGCVIISRQISSRDKELMNIHPGMKIEVTEGNKKYLEYHRNNIFKDNLIK